MDMPKPKDTYLKQPIDAKTWDQLNRSVTPPVVSPALESKIVGVDWASLSHDDITQQLTQGIQRTQTEFEKEYLGMWTTGANVEDKPLTYADIARMDLELKLRNWAMDLYGYVLDRQFKRSNALQGSDTHGVYNRYTRLYHEYRNIKWRLAELLETKPEYLKRHLPTVLGGDGVPTDDLFFKTIYSRLLISKITR